MSTVRYSYNVEIHGDDTAGWSASVPDLHVFAAAATRRDVVREVTDAAQWHVNGLIEDGLPVPEPSRDAEQAMLTVRA